MTLSDGLLNSLRQSDCTGPHSRHPPLRPFRPKLTVRQARCLRYGLPSRLPTPRQKVGILPCLLFRGCNRDRLRFRISYKLVVLPNGNLREARQAPDLFPPISGPGMEIHLCQHLGPRIARIDYLHLVLPGPLENHPRLLGHQLTISRLLQTHIFPHPRLHRQLIQ
jgi:hypothetical protein